MAKTKTSYRTVGRILVGAGEERKVIEPDTDLDPAAAGLDEEEMKRLVQSGAVREVAEEPNAPADGPREQTPAATDTPASGAGARPHSETISREQPQSDESSSAKPASRAATR
jgi:hypothetical protein